MSLLLVFIIAIIGIISGKLLLRKWINPLTVYSLIMGGLIFLYELKLIAYPDIIPMAWFYLISSFISLLLGITTIVTARNLYPREEVFKKESVISLKIFADGGETLKYSIIFFTAIAFFVAIHRWYILIGMFGSIPAVFLNAGLVYRLNVHGEIKEFIPILPSFIYVAVFLLGIYTAYKGRFSLLTFMPFVAIVLKELTYFGRGEILFTLIEFVFSFFLFRHLLNDDSSNRFKFSRKNAAVALTILFLFLVAAVSLVRVSRGGNESYVGTSKELKQLEDNFIISPSVYMYLSSDVGVFSKYLEKEEEDTKFAENTFKVFYFFLSRFDIVEKPDFFQKGYFIPMWTNTGTYVREWHADFGPAGVFLGPYILGLLIAWLWFKFYIEKSLVVFMFLVYLHIIIGFSFLMIVTRLNQWYFSQFFILLFLPIIERIALSSKARIAAKNK